MNDGGSFVAGLIVASLVWLASFGITLCVCQSVWQAECVARGVAEYDAKTGEWKWKVEKESEVSDGP